MLHRYITWIVRHRVAVILFTVALSVGFATQIGHLRVIIDPNDSLPQDHPYVKATNDIERLFGGRNLVVIGIEPVAGDVFDPTVLDTVARLTTAVLDIPGVVRSNVMSLAARKAKDIQSTGDGMVVRPLMAGAAPADIDQMRRALAANPVYVDAVVSLDGRMAVIIADVAFTPALPTYRAIQERVEAVVAPFRDESVRLSLSGLAINLAWLEIYSERMGPLFLAALAVIMAVLYLSFRSLQGMLVPMATAIMSVLWSLGIMGGLAIPMDTFNATTPILIMAIAAGHSVQILKRYYEEYARVPDSRAAVIVSLEALAPVMLTAGTIAALSFLALTIFPTLTMRIFGLFTAIGIVAAILLELTFIPACRAALPPPRAAESQPDRPPDWLDRRLQALGGSLTAGRWRELLAPVAIAGGILLLGITLVRVDNSLKGNFAPDSPVRLDDERLNRAMGGTNTLYVLIEGQGPDAMKDPAVLQAIDDLQRYAGAHDGLVGKTQSLVDLLKTMHRAMNGAGAEFDRVPESHDLVAQYLLLYSLSGDPGDFDAYVDYDYRSAVVWMYLKTDSTASIDALLAGLRAFIGDHFPPGYTVSLGGGMAQGAALNDVMVHGKLINIGALAAGIYVISSVALRSVAAGAFVLIPLVLTVLANFGVMGWLGIRLDIGTAAVSAMAVGVGADYAIYLIYRLREQLHREGDIRYALITTLRTAGKAIVYVALAVGSGYAMLMLTGLAMHARLGFLVATAMTVSCVAAIVVLPAALMLIRPAFLFARGTQVPQASPRCRAGGAGLREDCMKTCLAACLLVVFGAVSPLMAADLSARDIMERNFHVAKLPRLTNESTMTLINDKGQQRVRKMRSVIVLQPNGIDSHLMIRFLYPPDVQGTGFLQLQRHDAEDDMWIYLPALKKVRRLIANNKKDSFVGSDFSYGDILLPPVDTYHHRLVATESLGGEDCYVIESVPASEQVKHNYGYARRTAWIRTSNFMEKKVVYDDTAGRLLKTQTVPDVKELDPERHRWWAVRREVVNHQTGHRTVLTFEILDPAKPVQADFFTPRYLERER